MHIEGYFIAENSFIAEVIFKYSKMRHWDETEKQTLLPQCYKDPLPLQTLHWKKRVMLFQYTQFRIYNSRVLTSPERWRITLIFPKAFNFPILWEIEISFLSVFLSGLHVKNCFPVLLCIICASTTKHSLAAIILCVSLCLRDFCSSRRPLIKVLLDRLTIQNPFFQIS